MKTETKNCQSCKEGFVVEQEDFAMYEKIGIPAPDQCPRCRWKYLLAFWNFGRFRKTESALSGKSLITNFPPSVTFPLYDRTEWVSDEWDPMEYGVEYDSSRSFFEQVEELQKKVPHPHQSGTKNIGCQWADDVWSSKNCYLCRSLFECEDLSYAYRVIRCKNSIDLVYCFDTEYSYDSLYCTKCYRIQHSYDTHDSMDSAFLFDCRNCTNCFMSWNLRNKQYCIYNKQYSKEEYFEKLREFDMTTRDGREKLKQEFDRILREEAVHRANQNIQVSNVYGNFLEECKNLYNCYFLEQSENTRHTFRGFANKEVIDSVGSGFIEKSAFSNVDLHVYDSMATSHSSNCRYSAYLDYCEECEYCFGCVGLRKKKYCILNKQYSKEEYNTLVAKIKEDMKERGEWGRFFPLSMVYSGYNLSLAQSFYPETQESVKAFGGYWDEQGLAGDDAVKGDLVPQTIDEIDNEFSKQKIACVKTQFGFNIAPHELAFYKEYDIPPPNVHFDVRILERFRPVTLSMNPQKGICMFCKKEIEHFYSPELGYQKIACVECYQAEVA